MSAILHHRRASEILQHRELKRHSGLTIGSYCKRENISPSSWWYWCKRLISHSAHDDKN